MWRVLPRFAVHSTLSYPQLMASMAHLWQRYPALRRAALAQGALSIAFSAFWSTLAVMLSEHYHMGSAVAGGFGIAGAAGALAAPLAGGLADKFGAGKVTQMECGAGHPLLCPDVCAAAAASARSVGADCPVGDWL